MENIPLCNLSEQSAINDGTSVIPAKNATDEQYQKLVDNIRITAKTRFQASTRLAFHHKVSQWTIAMSSVVLVMASLLAMPAGAAQALPRAGEIEIILAVFVLVLSLLIGMDNYSLRADKMHTCALELNALVRDYSVIDKSNYSKLANEYGDVLNKFENHGNVDFELTKLRAAVSDKVNETPQVAGNSIRYRGRLRAMILLRYTLSLLPYAAASLVVILSIWYFAHKLLN